MVQSGVGVDFGTSTTLAATSDTVAGASILPLGRATTWLPSVARVDGARLIVGEDADSGERQLRSVKRAITQRRATLPVGGQEVDADGVIAEVLAEVGRRCAAIGMPLDDGREVRLGCPAMWDGPQRRRLVAIAARVGLTVAGGLPVDEPVAAGLAWLAHRHLVHGERPQGTLLVFDMGGGTLDVAVLSVAGGPTPEVTVRASMGQAMAGDALDVAIARDLVADLLRAGHEVDAETDLDLVWALMERAGREAKVRLSSVAEHPVVLPRALGYPRPLRYTQARLEAAFEGQLDGAESLVFAALRAARLARDSVTGPRVVRAGALRGLPRADLVAGVDHVLLAGGMSRIPYVAQRLAALLPMAALHTSAGVEPEELVAAGLAATAGHARIRLPQPGFDLTLGPHTVYEAHTPLLEPWQLYSGDPELSHLRHVPATELPAAGVALVRAVTVEGRPVGLRLDGDEIEGLPVRLGPAGVTVRVGHDGLSLVDGEGQRFAARTDGWPTPGGAEPVSLRRAS